MSANDLETVNDMLKEINIRYKEEKKRRKDSALDFNFFNIANVEYDEVRMCRVLFEILRPDGKHGRGIAFLETFMKEVLKIDDIDIDELRKAKVEREVLIKDNRRIDLVIDTPKRYIPIEVKIYARDQNKQCHDYYWYAEKRNSDRKNKNKWNLYYLTLSGYSPAEESTVDNIVNNGTQNISWENDIVNWLENIRTIDMPVNITEILKEFLDTVRMLTGQMEGWSEIMNNVILKDAAALRSAAQIYEGYPKAQCELLKEVFKDVKKRFENIDHDSHYNNVNKINDMMLRDISEDEKIKTYYDKKGSTFPGIAWKVRELNSPDTHNDKKYELILRIEIDYRPFIGICIAEIRDNGQYARGDTLPDGIIERALALIGENNDEESKRDGWWIYWEYIPTDGRMSDDDVPNFKEGNEAYFSLAIEEEREKFADACYIAFDKFQKKIK